MTLKELQLEVGSWAARNFPNAKPHQPLMGAVEESGELAEAGSEDAAGKLAIILGRLCHAHLKMEQGIRTGEDHYAAKVDAVADCVIFLAHYCSLNDIDMDFAVHTTWQRVRNRNWRKNPENGA